LLSFCFGCIVEGITLVQQTKRAERGGEDMRSGNLVYILVVVILVIVALLLLSRLL
jgi:uncharacterized membrane protein YidH (DUF202 family)